MLKRKLSTLILAATITNLVATPANVFAETLTQNNVIQADEVVEENQSKEATVSKFSLYGSKLLESYNEVFKMDNSNIDSITNNGGKYGSSTIDKAIDENFETHWETGSPNSSNFTNEVIVNLKEVTTLNRIVYAARPDAGGKGFAEEFEIYVSKDDSDNFELVTTGEYKGSRSDVIEIKFDATEFKRVKFVFKKANQGWASASEFMFYKEDNIMDKMNNIFTNESKNELSDDFNTLEKLEAFELEASNHPLYSEIEEEINNAKIILEGKPLEFTEAKVSNFKDFNDERLDKYNELFKVSLEKVTSITTNGGNYASNVIERAMDGDVNTNWHSGKQNTADHTNEVIITLDELTTIDRIMYTSLVSRGFAQEFEIYGSRTSEGDTFEKISEGTASITTKNTLQIKFKETEVRRIKFVYKKGYENWALANEFGLYMPDELDQKIDRLFVDENMNEVSPVFGTIEAINNLIEEAKGHPFEDEYIEKLNTAKELVEFGKVQSGTANVSKFEPFYTEYINEYDDVYRVKNLSISNNGGQYSNSAIKYAIDEDANTHWETGNPNSISFQNEVIFDLGEVNEIDKIAYAARNGGKGFATKFAIYVSTEVEGDDFRLAGTGSYNGSVNDVIEIDITKTEARRVKFKFIEANQNWASIAEMSFYKTDELADKIAKELFTDNSKSQVTEKYNTLEKLDALREEVSTHPASELFQEDLNRAEEIIRAKFPCLTVGETEYIKLRSEYDLISNVNASDQEDGDITNKIVVNSNDFTTNKTGEYKVSYTVTDNDGNIATAEKTIVVYSDSEYLSNIDWDSARTDYGQVRKDLASVGSKIKLSINGEEKVFDKGIGTHANSEIVYNLEGRNYKYFETYVGVDRNIAKQNNSSVIFKIYADGEEVYNSGVMKWDDEAKLVRIPLEGVSELKLVADNAGNGNTSDHASFADAKFLILNAIPTLNIPKSVSTKVGQPIDLKEGCSASDAEDGDLTSSIEISGEINFNKAGKYELTYNVTDSDGNTVTKTRTVAVVDMDDYTYLTEYDWNSTKNSYATPNKDISTSGRTLRLTGEDGQEVSYERGIGAHSTSTIIYDLSDKDYVYFSSYVGVDRQMYGSVGSITFEVWVDGEKKFDSGLMTSKDVQKYVEVDINGAKELKLVVTDGGDNNHSDHATWADAKLHFANNEGVDLAEVVNIPDKYLKKAIKAELNISSDDITIGDMYNLTELNDMGYGIEDLEGLQYAKNLETLNLDYNEISDLSKLKNLRKLSNLQAMYQNIALGNLYKQDNKITVKYNAINRQGEAINVSSIIVRNNITLEDIYLNIEECIDENGVISFDTTNFANNFHTLYLVYESEEDNYLAQAMYMFDNR